MKEKFARSADSGVKIGFRLPDGNKTDHTFPTCSTVKVHRLSTVQYMYITNLTVDHFLLANYSGDHFLYAKQMGVVYN